MLVRDIIYNNSFDCNCNYRIYDCTGGKAWNDGADLIYSTAKNGYDKPPNRILNMEVRYITIHDSEIVIEGVYLTKPYYVTFAVSCRYTVAVQASSLEEALEEAKSDYCDADFGEAADIDGYPIIVEDSDGNYIWEKD